MRNPHALPVLGAVMSRIGLFAIIMAIVGGLLAMHVMGGAQAMAMEPAPMASTAATTTHTTTPNHTASSTAPPAAHPMATLVAPSHQGDPMDCGGSPSDGHASMNGHETCVPSFGPDTLGVPLPGILTWAHPETAFTSTPGPKSKGRVPDPPSLAQLSIIRT